ncbi:MAG: hypothetical protein PF440_01655, partial [Thiomicrorhabdus sp.]|nr:hypothetical protein [Thiomicrorhabdus sp.]
MATRAGETLNNSDDDIRAILKLKDSDPIPQAATDMLTDMGANINLLSESVGQDIYDLLGVKPTDEAGVTDEARFIKSLGIHAIVAMEKQGYLTRTTVFTGARTARGKKGYGIIGLLDNLSDDVITDKGSVGKPVTTYFRIGTQKGEYSEEFQSDYAFTESSKHTGISEEILQVTQSFKGSPHAWDKLLHGEEDKKRYSFTKPKAYKAGALRTLKRTFFKATGYQSRNIHDYEYLAWKMDAPMTNLYFMMSDYRLDMVGSKEIDNELVINRTSTQGINNGLKREHENTVDFITDALTQENGLQSEFYIPNELWRNYRMGQVGPVNPQGSKIQRELFAQTGQENTFNSSQTKWVNLFLKSVGTGLGIESGKVGGVAVAIEETEKRLQEPVFRDALDALGNIGWNFDLSTLDKEQLLQMQVDHAEDMKIIARAVNEGGEKLHTLKVLTEYARYENAMGDDFTTNLTIEIDGVTNGPILYMYQLMTNDVLGLGKDGNAVPDKIGRVLAALSNGGSSFITEEAPLDERLSDEKTLDAYQGMGHELALGIQKIKKELAVNIGHKNKHINMAARNGMRRMQIISEMIGEPYTGDDGYLNNWVRKFTKKPTMTTLYGITPAALNIAFVNDFINEHFYNKLSEIITYGDVAGFRDLTNNMRWLIDPDNMEPIDFNKLGYIEVDYKSGQGIEQLNKEKARAFKLSTDDINTITEHFSLHEGKALTDATTTLYGDFMVARKKVDTATTLMTAMYNAAFTTKMNEVLAEKKSKQTPENKANEVDRAAELTVGEYNKIEKELQKMYPYTGTPFGQSSSDPTVGRVPVSKKDKTRLYGSSSDVQITFNKQSDGTPIRDIHAGTKLQNLLKNPGVAASVLLTHLQDAAIANRTIGGMADKTLNLLNVHDGFFAGIKKEHDTNQTLNKNFTETVGSFDLAGSV